MFTCEGFVIASDAGYLGGTKRRALELYAPMLLDRGDIFVYATPAYGFAQIAAAAVFARKHRKRVVLFVALRNQLHERTRIAQRLGAEIRQVPVGYMTVCKARAREFASEDSRRVLIPFGLDDPLIIRALATNARLSISYNPPEVWCAGGSGVLTRALQHAFPAAKHFAVKVGANGNYGSATVIDVGISFERPAKIKPPFDSCANYDAKVWGFMRERAQKGSLFWNVAGDRIPEYEEGITSASALLRARANQIRKGVI